MTMRRSLGNACSGQSAPRGVLTAMVAISGLTALFILGQVLLLFLREKALCLNQGCAVVEELLRIPPLWFNLMGAGFFLLLFLLTLTGRRRGYLPCPLPLLLLAGAAAEGVLVAYQAFVARAFCSYCLTICGALLLLNLLAGRRQVVTAVAVFLVPLLLFSLLQFRPVGTAGKKVTIDNGTWGIRQCSNPERQLYLIFSEECPHCRRVLQLLEGCSRCELHFNPIHAIAPDLLPGVRPEKDFDPAVNIATLNMLGIDTIPVLIEKQPTGWKFIQGEGRISSYLRKNCLGKESATMETIPAQTLQWLELEQKEDGECRIESNCDDNLIPRNGSPGL